VCRYWRESIVSTPENWASISNRGSRTVAAASLKRVKSSPLKIYLSIAPDNRWLSDLLIPYIQNIKTVDVHYISAIDLKTALPDFPQSVPNLRSLTFVTEQDSECDQFADLFESLPPTLRYLKLSGVSLYPSLLKLRMLMELDLHDRQFNLHLDTLLDFIEGNQSLESVTLEIILTEPFLRSLRHRTPIKNRLRSLRIVCFDVIDGQALISNIGLSKGAELELYCCPLNDISVMVNDVLSGISTTHHSNLLSPTSMEYCAYKRTIRLLGPNGTATFFGRSPPDIPFVEFPRLPLTNVRRLHLDTRSWDWITPRPGPAMFHQLSFFPVLETLTIECDTVLSHLLSPLFSNPSSSPSLKTLGFLGCNITGRFMEELTRFASDRKDTTSARLHCVAILDRKGKFPSIGLIRELEEHVPIVDVRISTRIPTDLT
jgi:hypothetical protein